MNNLDSVLVEEYAEKLMWKGFEGLTIKGY